MELTAILFLIFIGIGILFQLALVFGAPWGELTMGGQYPGKLPAKLRFVVLFQILILLAFACTVLVKTSFMLPQLYHISSIVMWVIVAFFVLGSFLNIITKSVWERRIWAPVNIILLVLSVMIAVDNG